MSQDISCWNCIYFKGNGVHCDAPQNNFHSTNKQMGRIDVFRMFPEDRNKKGDCTWYRYNPKGLNKEAKRQLLKMMKLLEKN